MATKRDQAKLDELLPRFKIVMEGVVERADRVEAFKVLLESAFPPQYEQFAKDTDWLDHWRPIGREMVALCLQCGATDEDLIAVGLPEDQARAIYEDWNHAHEIVSLMKALTDAPENEG